MRLADDSWGTRQEIISTFAGEPTLTAYGKTLYFVHHYVPAEDLSHPYEADIYVTQHVSPQ